MNILQKFYNMLRNRYYHMKEARAEAKYDKMVTDFYENGIGYYGK